MADNMQGQQGSAQSQFQRQQQLKQQLIRPEQFNQIPGLSQEQRTKYIEGATSFWHHINTKPPNDPSHQEAVNKLQQLTNAMRNHIANAKQKQQLPGNQAQQPSTSQGPQSQPMQRPLSQGQLGQPGQPNGQVNINNQQRPAGAPQQTRPASQPPAYNQLPESIRRAAEAITYYAPSTAPDQQLYKQEARSRYGQQLYLQQTAKANIQQLQPRLNEAQVNGQPIPESLQQQKAALEKQFQASSTFLQSMKQQQDGMRLSQTGAQPQQPVRNINGQVVNNNNNNNNATNQALPQQPGAGMPNTQQRSMPQNTAQQPQVNRQGPAGSPSTAQAPTPAALSQQAQQAQQAQQQQQFQRPQPPNQATNTAFSQTSPQSAGPQASQPPNPYTQQGQQGAAAMDQRTYSNGGSAQPAGPQMTNQQFATPTSDKANKWAINKDFTPRQPVPVQMGQTRPTMAGPYGGQSGPMGQPAIQQPPSYNLHGPGDHVLDKKKLDELVRQVCGAGNGTNAQGLHPEVEESILELADEFFDNVVTSACRLAKLRGSQQLEIKDLQLVLQRQYNIRIPGYSSDEVRTVRKIQPTPSYLQKMNAIQAAKVMGGKVD